MKSPRHPAVRRLPDWLRKPLAAGPRLSATRRVVADSGVATVCAEARCPNCNECWARGTATFMILGDRCTRGCRFCAVASGPPAPPAADEPRRLAEAVAGLGLRHAVVTAVARDDLPDHGAGHFAACVEAIRERCPSVTIEVLPADFGGRRDRIETLCAARPDLYNHNLETVERLSPTIRPAAGYHLSLEVLRRVKAIDPSILTKSGLMVGLGETLGEVVAAMRDLRSVGCEVLTIGQYLQPSPAQVPVSRYWEPAAFDDLRARAESLGFAAVAAGPFVRSSYNAAEVFDAVCTRREAQP